MFINNIASILTSPVGWRRYAMHCSLKCPPGYTKKLVKDSPLTHFLVTPVEHLRLLCIAFNCGI